MTENKMNGGLHTDVTKYSQRHPVFGQHAVSYEQLLNYYLKNKKLFLCPGHFHSSF